MRRGGDWTARIGSRRVGGETFWEATVRMYGRVVKRWRELPSISHARLEVLEWSQRTGKSVRWNYDNDAS